MGEVGNIFRESNLKCDFPAREPFREALLSLLLSMDEQDMRDNQDDMPDDDFRACELSDDDLDMLAAAQGDCYGQGKRPAPLW